MTDETNAYAIKINGYTFISMDAAKSLVDEARMDGWNLALEEAAKVAEDYDGPGLDGGYDRHLGDGYETRRDIAAAIRAMVKE
jgi:hypothetical protein